MIPPVRVKFRTRIMLHEHSDQFPTLWLRFRCSRSTRFVASPETPDSRLLSSSEPRGGHGPHDKRRRIDESEQEQKKRTTNASENIHSYNTTTEWIYYRQNNGALNGKTGGDIFVLYGQGTVFENHSYIKYIFFHNLYSFLHAYQLWRVNSIK